MNVSVPRAIDIDALLLARARTEAKAAQGIEIMPMPLTPAEARITAAQRVERLAAIVADTDLPRLERRRARLELRKLGAPV